MNQARKNQALQDWRDRYNVHPFADQFPMITGAERDQLRDDIRKHGILEEIVLWRDNSEAAANSTLENALDAVGKGPLWLVDGRNRLDVAQELGMRLDAIPRRYVSAYRLTSSLSNGKSRWEDEIPDAEAFILSLNVHRRHLTVAQRKKFIARYEPHVSDRKIARDLKLSPHTVAKERAKDGDNVQSAQNRHPIERAKAAVQANPEASNRELAREAKVGKDTVAKARKTVRLKPEPKSPATQTVRKRRDAAGAERALSELLEQFEKTTLQKAWQTLGLD
jgi:hypothetical protein